ncbi:uncharacterized protein LOC127878608 [Dreissena polymorpha]|uniref:uncharacterized protein LOC127878608 n=1 Tax=Dreissena polymorpha TaxID=45954 RepID=UPI002264B91A|nr:uncharacterized protein LOC127878608 [Dreissena polymorpha]
METLLKFDPDLREHSLSVQANVTEYETGEVRILQKEISFHSSAIQLEFLTYSTDVYRPGFPFSTYVIIRQPDGRPLVSNGERVKVSATFFTFNDSTPQRMFRPPNSPSANLMTFVSPFRNGRVILAPDTYIAVPSNGVMKIDFEIPENALSGHIEVSFKDKKITKNIESFRTKSRAYINLEMKSRFAKVGEQTEFSLSSNVVPQQKIVYHTRSKTEIFRE